MSPSSLLVGLAAMAFFAAFFAALAEGKTMLSIAYGALGLANLAFALLEAA